MTDKTKPHNGKSQELTNVHQPLTNVEKHMVDVFLSCHNETRTAEVVGRSRTWVKQRLKQPYIVAEIDQRQLDSANRADITNEWLLMETQDVIAKAKKDASWNAALKGIEMLMKVKGMFEEVENNGITYNVMGSVVLAPDEQAAQRLVNNPEQPIDADYEVMQFNVGDDVETVN